MTAVCEKPAGPPEGTKLSAVVTHAKEGRSRQEIAAIMKITLSHVDTSLHTARKNGWLAPATTGRPAKDRPRETKPVAPKPAAVVTPLAREARASVAVAGETQSETPAQTIARLEKELTDAREQTRKECADLMRLYGTDLETARAERDEARAAVANAEARLENAIRERDAAKRELANARAALESIDSAGSVKEAEERLQVALAQRGTASAARTVTVRKDGVEIEIAGVEDAAKLVRLLA